MSLFVSIEDREGESLIEVFEVDAVHKRFPDTGTCLRFVRDTTDASFNHMQTPILCAELEALIPLIKDAMEIAELQRVIKVCKKFSGKPDAFIRFYGESRRED